MKTVYALLLLLLIAGCADRQEMIHERGSEVMPFELDASTHVFQTTETGGVQQVIVNNQSDETNIKSIQEHMQEIAQEFSQGNFSDPQTLHGQTMPGVETLEENHQSLTINYTNLTNGAQITYTSQDSVVIQALHDWFAAQLQDHGSDATNTTECDNIPEGHDKELWAAHHGC